MSSLTHLAMLERSTAALLQDRDHSEPKRGLQITLAFRAFGRLRCSSICFDTKGR